MGLDDLKNELSSIRTVADLEKQTEQQRKAQLSMDAEQVLAQILPFLSDAIKALVKETLSATRNINVRKSVEIDLARLNNVLRLPESWNSNYYYYFEQGRATKRYLSEQDLYLHTHYRNVSVFRAHWEYIADKLIELTGLHKACDPESDAGCLVWMHLQSEEIRSGFLGKNKSYRYKSALISIEDSTYRTVPA